MSQKAAYIRFCSTAPDLPVFLEPWYLDAAGAAYGSWEVALVERNGQPVAVWPYFVSKKLGLTRSISPPLCKYVGPYLLPEYRTDRKLLATLIDQFPTFGRAEIVLDTRIDDWSLFHQRGWAQTTRYTFHKTRSTSHDFPADLDKRTRAVLRRAAQAIEVQSEELPVESMYELSREPFARQGIPIPYTSAHFRNIYEASVKHRRATCLVARDQSGELHGFLLLLHDRQRSYGLVSAVAEKFRSQNANYLLQQAAIQYTFGELELDTFDFLGSMIPGVAHLFRKMGAQQIPYHLLSRTDGRLLRWVNFLKSELKIRS